MPLGVSSVSAVQRLFQHDVAIATYCGAVNAIDNSSMFVVVSEWRWPDWTPASASPLQAGSLPLPAPKGELTHRFAVLGLVGCRLQPTMFAR